MTANAADFAGTRCGSRYEKELEDPFPGLSALLPRRPDPL